MKVKEYLRLKKLPHIWCAGCGNGTILGSIIKAVDGSGFSKDQVVLVTGIGCSARTNAIADFNTFQTTHGRALAFATGFKLTNPDLKVIVVTGDGDGAGIGGNHLIHTARRNLDITTVLVNNSIYGMTGGQYSPLSPIGTNATTAPYGTIEPPFDVCELVKAAGATYVARSTVYHVNLLEKLIKEALNHKGFSFVEVVSQCPIGFGRRNKMESPVEMLKWQKEHAVNIKTAKNNEPLSQGMFYVGELFRREDLPEYGEQYRQIVEKASKKR